MAKFGTLPEDTLALGDTRSDADMFQRAGVSIAIITGYTVLGIMP